MVHDTRWVEKNVRDGTVKFTCTVCGRTISGDKKKYGEGEWILPENH